MFTLLCFDFLFRANRTSDFIENRSTSRTRHTVILQYKPCNFLVSLFRVWMVVLSYTNSVCALCTAYLRAPQKIILYYYPHWVTYLTPETLQCALHTACTVHSAECRVQSTAPVPALLQYQYQRYGINKKFRYTGII